MKKILALVIFSTLAVFLTACNKYKGIAGTYELINVETELAVSVDSFEYYTVTLEANGSVIVRSHGKGQPESSKYEVTAKFTYNSKTTEIIITTKTGIGKVDEKGTLVGEILILNAVVGTSDVKLTFQLKKE